jgi:hypothetical protein
MKRANLPEFSRQCTALTPIRASFAYESAQTESPVKAYPPLCRAIRDACLRGDDAQRPSVF